MRKRMLKQFILMLVLVITNFTINTLAVGQLCVSSGSGAGFYAGLAFGQATNTAKPQQIQIRRLPRPQPPPPAPQIPPFVGPAITVRGVPNTSGQWGTRFFIGYMINSFAGFELGLTYFTTINYRINNRRTNPNNFQSCGSSNIRVYTGDIQGRLATPFSEWVQLFVKGGGAATFIRVSGDLIPAGNLSCGVSTNHTKFRPVAGIGIDVRLNQSWVVEGTYSRYFVGNQVGNIDYISIGISYHAVDRYCGQFLCDD